MSGNRNPVATIHLVHNTEHPIYRSVYTWCPGCNLCHPFRIELFPGCPLRKDSTTEPTWDWDGNLERPTFSPSMLAYGCVHLCPPDYVHHVVCKDPVICPRQSHLVLSTEPKILAHNLPHAVTPAWGNCHSFLQQGRWQFLSDSAHAMAGQTIDMISLPDYLL
jgi:hypothetical protein